MAARKRATAGVHAIAIPAEVRRLRLPELIVHAKRDKEYLLEAGAEWVRRWDKKHSPIPDRNAGEFRD